MRYPLRLVTLEIHCGDGPAEATELELVELRCTTKIVRAKAVTLLATLGREWIDHSEAPPLFPAQCTARNLLDQELEGVLTTRFRNWEREVLYEESHPWTLPPKGSPMTKLVQFKWPNPDEPMFVEATFEFRADGQRPATAAATYTLPLANPGDTTLVPESPWGMGVYLYRYPDSPEGFRTMDRAASLAQAAGVKWSREEFGWARTEPQQGTFDFDFYDVVVDTANRHGISVYGLLSYWSSWTEPYTEKGIDDFCVWARQVVRHFKDRVKYWEVYNEPNIFFWQGPKELYPVLLTRCYAAIKEEDPEAQVLGISTAGIDTKFIEECLEAGSPFDVLTVHPYRRQLDDRKFMGELRDVADLVGGRPVWITEMGWSTCVGREDERTQAELLARCYLGAVASGACQNVSWYDFRNDGTDPFYFETNFGVVRRDFGPKPAYRALAAVCRTLSDGLPRPRTDFGPNICAVETDQAIALWSVTDPVELRCRVVSGTPVVSNLMGEQLDATRDGDAVWLDLKPGAPVFVTGAALEPHAND